MIHPIYRVVSFAIVAPYILRVTFDDATTQVIDFSPILKGELYGPLREVALFNQVQLDPVRIPRNSATQSTGMLPRTPWECCHPVHGNVATLGASRRWIV